MLHVVLRKMSLCIYLAHEWKCLARHLRDCGGIIFAPCRAPSRGPWAHPPGAEPHAHRCFWRSLLGLSTFLLPGNFFINLPKHTITQQYYLLQGRFLRARQWTYDYFSQKFPENFWLAFNSYIHYTI